MNSALRELYLNRMSGMLEMINNDRNLSDPLLMSVDDKYLQAHTKIMVVGQETNGWEYDPKRDSGDDPGWPIQLSCNEYVDLLMQRYQNTHWKKSPAQKTATRSNTTEIHPQHSDIFSVGGA